MLCSCYVSGPSTKGAIYNKRLNEWTEDNAPTLPLPLAYHTMAPANRLKTKILVVGGQFNDLVHLYDWNKKIRTYIGQMSRGPSQTVALCFFKGSKSNMDRVSQKWSNALW